MSVQLTLSDIVNCVCDRFGISKAEARDIIRTPTHPRCLRDEFAVHAMNALIQTAVKDWPETSEKTNRVGKTAYQIADSMLRAREE